MFVCLLLGFSDKQITNKLNALMKQETVIIRKEPSFNSMFYKSSGCYYSQVSVNSCLFFLRV